MSEDDGEAARIVEHLLMEDYEDEDGDDTDEDKDAEDADPATTAAIPDTAVPETSTLTTLLYSKADEQQDMNATIEHLIIRGNYYRHQQWRMSEWERQNKNDVADKTRKNEDIGANDDAIPSRQHQKRRRTSGKESVGTNDSTNKVDVPLEGSAPKNAPVVIHAQDARLYNHLGEKVDGLEPDIWPKQVRKSNWEAPLVDHKWEQEFSDDIDPIEFSILRLSENTEPAITNGFRPNHHFLNTSNPNGAAQSLSSDNKVWNSEKAARIMVLQCWERAVHAASTTMTVSPPSSSLQEDQSSPPCSYIKRTRDEAIRICQKLSISPISTTATTTYTPFSSVDKFRCSGCGEVFATKDLLRDHFYGDDEKNDADDTCAWMCIDTQRQTRTALILENEFRTLSQQFTRHILFHPVAMHHLALPPDLNDWNQNAYGKPCLDGLAVLNMIQKDFDVSRKIRSSSRDIGSSTNAAANNNNNAYNMNDDTTVLETLEISSDESPLPINAAVLEAVRYRYMDRYGKVPR